MSHLPFLWRYRTLHALRAPNNSHNRKLLRAWKNAEGGTARFNPLNTTEPWAGATDYNSAGVKNYRTGADGIAATVKTLENGHYSGIVRDLRNGGITPCGIVRRNAGEFDTWGTGASLVERVLGCG